MEIASKFKKYFSKIPIVTTKVLKSSSMPAELLLKKYVREYDTNFEFSLVTPRYIMYEFKNFDLKRFQIQEGICINNFFYIYYYYCILLLYNTIIITVADPLLQPYLSIALLLEYFLNKLNIAKSYRYLNLVKLLTSLILDLFLC